VAACFSDYSSVNCQSSTDQLMIGDLTVYPVNQDSLQQSVNQIAPYEMDDFGGKGLGNEHVIRFLDALDMDLSNKNNKMNIVKRHLWTIVACCRELCHVQ